MLNGTPLEWVMFVMSAGALIMSFHIRMLSIDDFDRAKRERWSYAAVLIAEANVYGETINTVLSTICVVGGSIAVSTSPPPGSLADHAVWKLLCLIGVAVLSVTQGVRALWYRRRILGLESVRFGPEKETAIHDFGGTTSRT